MRLWWCICLLGLWTSLAHASPALPSDVIDDLNRLQTQLREQQYASVVSQATQQAERLRAGNDADRWASALYQQLAANALARQDEPSAAADRLAQARELSGEEQAQAARWLREEASLRRAAGQADRATELLSSALQSQAGQDASSQRQERWKLTRWLANDQRWQEAAEWLERSLSQTSEPDEAQRRLALAIYQRTQQTDQALDFLLRGLNEQSDIDSWRQAAALAQQSGQPGVAAALWDTAWQLDKLDEDDDRWQLIRLHMAGGTPARAAEYLEHWLAEGEVVRDEATLRLLANAWHQARDKTQALDAWQALATLSEDGGDWRQYGQLAFAWGQDERAEKALSRAHTLGDEQAAEWLATLEQSPHHSP
ncbi:hypothetical protein GA0071314_2211 [Halomonas sp. HL-93]|nr:MULTISPECIES: hypothetical protein [unclassified Halomonas]KPQ22201.1 MAG: TonB system TPR domain protein [Halomonas sp. HL-93]SBR49459.1 hypothetical protein GA0071314_2211 [Halomonas sp. HL-93]SNY96382.1 hypothetical protein SAMN04488142_0920 [Halomonas sp. hl-4]